MTGVLSTIAARIGGYRMDVHERNGRIATGFAERQLAGRWVGRIPYGYRRRLEDRSDGTRGWDGDLQIDPTEAEGVRWAFGAWLAGAPYSAIAVGLNARGHRTRIGRSWGSRTVKVMLRNPVYVGKLVRYRRPHPDHFFTEAAHEIGRPFPAIVSDEMFEASLALGGWPRPRRPFDAPTEWARYLARMTPERRAEVRARDRAYARRYRLEHPPARGVAIASHSRTPAGDRGTPRSDRRSAVNHSERREGDAE